MSPARDKPGAEGSPPESGPEGANGIARTARGSEGSPDPSPGEAPGPEGAGNVYRQLYELGAWFVLVTGGNRGDKVSKRPAQKWRDRRPEWEEVERHTALFDNGLPALGVIPARLGLMVVDADRPGPGIDWPRVEKEVGAKLGPCLAAARTDGKNRGLHLYYRSARRGTCRTAIGKSTTSVRVRSGGPTGYVILWDPAKTLACCYDWCLQDPRCQMRLSGRPRNGDAWSTGHRGCEARSPE